MPRTIRISGGLYACLLTIYMYIAQLLFLPGAVMNAAGQEGWLSVLIGGFIGLTITLLGSWVMVRHPGKTVAQVSRLLLGKWPGSLVALIYAGFFTWLCSLVLRDVYDFVTLVLLPGTPGRVVVIALCGVALYAVWSGLEPVARVSFQVLVTLVLAAIVIPILLYREFSVLQVDPFLTKGLEGVLKGTWLTAPWFSEAFIVMTLVPHLKRPADAYRWSAVSTVSATAIESLMVGMTSLVFGSILPTRLAMPVYNLVQMVALARIFERLELVIVVIWVSGMFVKTSMCLYAASEAGAGALGLKSHRWVAVGVAVAAVSLTRLWPGALDLVWFGTSQLHNVSHLSIEWGIPVLLLSASLLRGAFAGKETAGA